MDSQRLPNAVKWDGWPGSTTRDDTSAPTTYQTKQDQSYVQMNKSTFSSICSYQGNDFTYFIHILLFLGLFTSVA